MPLAIKLNIMLLWSFIPIITSLVFLAAVPQAFVDNTSYFKTRLFSIIRAEHAEKVAIRALVIVAAATFFACLVISTNQFQSLQNDRHFDINSTKTLHFCALYGYLSIGLVQIEVGLFKYSFYDFFIYDDWYTTLIMGIISVTAVMVRQVFGSRKIYSFIVRYMETEDIDQLQDDASYMAALFALSANKVAVVPATHYWIRRATADVSFDAFDRRCAMIAFIQRYLQ
jgi:hypothetical protein